MATESPKMRIGRMFGLGKYGYVLAEEILLQFQVELEEELRHNGYESAAEYLIDRRGPSQTAEDFARNLGRAETAPLPE